MKDKTITNKHVLIAGAGSFLKKYWGKIEKFIEEEDVITMGCNNINDVFAPDYHLWGSNKRWHKYGMLADKNSIQVFPYDQTEDKIREHWQGPYQLYDSDIRPHRSWRKCESIYHCFENITLVSIFYAYEKGASKISVVGLDGWTFYSKNEIDDGTGNQYCFNEKDVSDVDYARSRRKDILNYKRLQKLSGYGLKKYGFEFEIITPTVYKTFYNADILNIQEKYRGKIPSSKEKTKLYKIIGI